MTDNYFELRQLLRTDALTGVGNMIGFYESLYSRLENNPDTPFSLISIDINGLKEVNDNFVFFKETLFYIAKQNV